MSKDCVSQMMGGRFILIVSLINAAQSVASAAARETTEGKSQEIL